MVHFNELMFKKNVFLKLRSVSLGLCVHQFSVISTSISPHSSLSISYLRLRVQVNMKAFLNKRL